MTGIDAVSGLGAELAQDLPRVGARHREVEQDAVEGRRLLDRDLERMSAALCLRDAHGQRRHVLDDGTTRRLVVVDDEDLPGATGAMEMSESRTLMRRSLLHQGARRPMSCGGPVRPR